MNARFAHVLSRLSIVSVVAVSALGATACSRASTTTSPAATEATQAAPSASEHTPGRPIFRQVEALDLRADQRAAVSEIEQNLRADLTPHRETVRQVAKLLASGIEAGQLDAAEVTAQQAALAAAVSDIKGSFAGAMNGIHDVLDAGQRATLVAKLQEKGWHDHGHRGGAENHDGALAKVAFELGLSEEQKTSLRDAVRNAVEDVFPDRKTRREASEAKMKALADAFVTDGFDAADFDLGAGSEQALESFGTIATRAIDISGRVLTASQRQAVAAMLRDRADRI